MEITDRSKAISVKLRAPIIRVPKNVVSSLSGVMPIFTSNMPALATIHVVIVTINPSRKIKAQIMPSDIPAKRNMPIRIIRLMPMPSNAKRYDIGSSVSLKGAPTPPLRLPVEKETLQAQRLPGGTNQLELAKGFEPLTL